MLVLFADLFVFLAVFVQKVDSIIHNTIISVTDLFDRWFIHSL